MLTFLTASAQTLNLRGTVSNNSGKPVANAIVTLVGQGLKDTTGSDGTFKFINGTPVILPFLKPQLQTLVLDKGFLGFSLPTPSSVKVEIFDIKGNLLKKVLQSNAPQGFFRFNIEENIPSSKLFIIRAVIGENEFTFRYLPLQNKIIVNQSEETSVSVGSKLSKLAVINDTLKTSASGYVSNVKAITSYDQQITITLDTVGNESAKRSPGCGKLTSLAKDKDIVETISSGGKTREYIIRLPADYDPNTAYKLWFSLHCANGTAAGVATGSAGTNYQYYGIWKFANPTGKKGTTIFCAAQGINKLWSNTNDSDVEFIRALVKKFSNDYCIDMSRIFSEGFSMGGAMSYTLACAMPDTFKAVCMHEGGGLPMCTKSYRGPVGMFITHATDDGWPGAGLPQLKDLAQTSSCTPMDVASMITPAPDLMHPVCVEYKGCKDGFPCRACVFKGGHTPSPGTEGAWGEANTWVDDSTWSYFKRFY
jgi:dienelactone hydrolase